jgi:hypothetical protein
MDFMKIFQETEKQSQRGRQKQRELEGEFDIYLLPKVCVCKSHFGLD